MLLPIFKSLFLSWYGISIFPSKPSAFFISVWKWNKANLNTKAPSIIHFETLLGMLVDQLVRKSKSLWHFLLQADLVTQVSVWNPHCFSSYWRLAVSLKLIKASLPIQTLSRQWHEKHMIRILILTFERDVAFCNFAMQPLLIQLLRLLVNSSKMYMWCKYRDLRWGAVLQTLLIKLLRFHFETLPQHSLAIVAKYSLYFLYSSIKVQNFYSVEVVIPL